MKIIILAVICYASVGFAHLLGYNESTGLFGAILGSGVYLIHLIEKN